MLPKERVKAAVNHRQTDIVPANFECVDVVMDRLKKHFGYSDDEQVLERLGSDFRSIQPRYIGPERKTYHDVDGSKIVEGYWGNKVKYYWTGMEYHGIFCNYPLDEMETIQSVKAYNWPITDWFDYESIKEQCERHKDKAIIIGHEGVFQWATHIRSMEKLLVDMVLQPEFAHAIFDKIVEFELEHYEKILISGDGQIDILRIYDDYGTQISMLFGVDMWREFFMKNTKKLVNLAHKYGAFLQQHSCGAIAQVIPELYACGVDILEPIQKVKGLEPEKLKEKFGDKMTFHGGIDTQHVLPFGTPDEVIAETNHYIDVLHRNGGYILMGSQGFESDVPTQNIFAMYSVRDPSLLSK